MRSGTRKRPYVKTKTFYKAKYVRYLLMETNNKDFAILVLGDPKQQEKLSSFPIQKTDEFSVVNDQHYDSRISFYE